MSECRSSTICAVVEWPITIVVSSLTIARISTGVPIPSWKKVYYTSFHWKKVLRILLNQMQTTPKRCECWCILSLHSADFFDCRIYKCLITFDGLWEPRAVDELWHWDWFRFTYFSNGDFRIHRMQFYSIYFVSFVFPVTYYVLAVTSAEVGHFENFLMHP